MSEKINFSMSCYLGNDEKQCLSKEKQKTSPDIAEKVPRLGYSFSNEI